MILSLAVFVVTYVCIATEKVDKTIAALVGAAVVIFLHCIPYDDALHAVDLNVLYLLIGMMIVMQILSETGLFQWIAVVIAQKAKGNAIVLLAAFLAFTAFTSAFLDNVTTVILIAPITILITQILEVDAIPFLVFEAIFSNIGGTATLIGDPPNVLIGSQSGLTFNQFLIHLTPIIVMITAICLSLIVLIFRKSLHVKPAAKKRIMIAKPHLAITDAPKLKRGLIVFVFILLGFFLSHVTKVQCGVVALAGAVIMTFVCRSKVQVVFEKVEWNTIFFFVGLFMLVGALEYNHVFEEAGSYIVRLTGGNLLLTCLLLLWFSAISSAIVDNIPLVMAMIPLIKSMVPGMAAGLGMAQPQVAEPLYWCLALGACLGGNGTLVGASANVVVTQIAVRNNYNLTFWGFTRYGFPTMIVTLVASTVYVYVRYFLLAKP